MYIKAVFLFVTIFFAITVSGQSWVSGKVFLDDTVVDATFQFNSLLLEGALVVMDGNRRITLMPNQIAGFSFLDPESGEQKLFRSRFAKEAGTDYGIWVFVEVIYQNDFFRLYQRNFSSGYHPLRSASSRLLFEFEFVFLEREGEEVIWFYSRKPSRVDLKTQDLIQNPNRKLLFLSFGDFKKILKTFIKRNKLSFRSKIDVIKMLSEYEMIRRMTTPISKS